MKRFLGSVLAGLLVLPTMALADESEAQAVIKSQLEAFIARNDDAAYSFAAPNVRAIFPNQDIFMRMVRNGYPQVYSPKNYSFGRSQVMGDGQFAQEVLLTGPKNRDWAALYTVKKQEDGQYRITGVQVVPSNSTSL